MADLPAPADAQRLFAWRTLDGHSARAFIGYRTRIDDPGTPVLIEVLGLQYANGVTLRTIGIDGIPDEITPAVARQIAAACNPGNRIGADLSPDYRCRREMTASIEPKVRQLVMAATNNSRMATN